MTESSAESARPLSAARAAAVPMLAGAGVLLGTWALLPRYVGPVLELGPRGDQLEFVDHTVPGTLVIVLSLAALLLVRLPSAGSLLFGFGLLIVLAGLWMDATHLPLVLQALRDQAPWPATVHHSLPGVAVLVFGIVWCLVFRTPTDPTD